jgi:hypothetical protein
VLHVKVKHLQLVMPPSPFVNPEAVLEDHLKLRDRVRADPLAAELADLDIEILIEALGEPLGNGLRVGAVIDMGVIAIGGGVDGGRHGQGSRKDLFHSPKQPHRAQRFEVKERSSLTSDFGRLPPPAGVYPRAAQSAAGGPDGAISASRPPPALRMPFAERKAP